MALVPPSLNFHTMYKTSVHKASIKIDHNIIKNKQYQLIFFLHITNNFFSLDVHFHVME